jgi:SAM-dependent methyltransferase
MELERFFELFLKELEGRPEWWTYYKFHLSAESFQFRKAYFCQRLEYISNALSDVHGPVWDIGCGYGTTAIFLALNGHKVHGNTLEFYYPDIADRLKYWSQFGDVSGFTYDYADLFEMSFPEPRFAAIVVQDTLHHLEPIDQALSIIQKSLWCGGRMIAVEENGNNLIQSLKLYRQRGNRRIIEMYDERLRKTILLGNENIRSVYQWGELVQRAGMSIIPDSIKYVRVLPPSLFNLLGYQGAISFEQKVARFKWLREGFCFGLNFQAQVRPS